MRHNSFFITFDVDDLSSSDKEKGFLLAEMR